MKNRVFYYEHCGTLKECTNLQLNGYFLAGYQTPEDKGLLYTLSRTGEGGGTCLTPVYDENKQKICRPEYAGREVKALNINLNNL